MESSNTSSRLVGTSVEDSDVFLATFLHDTITLILDQHANSTWELPTSRDSCSFDLELPVFII